MKFQNKRNTASIWLNKFVLTLFFIILLIAVGFVRWFDIPVLGMERVYWIVIIVSFWFIIILIQNLRQPCYIYFEDTQDTIIIRYYPLRIINQKKNSIEISKKSFVRYETVKFYMGAYEKLIIYQRFKNGIAKYPPVSLSAVDRKDIEKIKKILGKYVVKN